MQILVNQCLSLVIKDDVDQVVWALDEAYFWFVRNNKEEGSSQNELQRLLDKISQTLMRDEYSRQSITEKERVNLSFRDHKTIVDEIIQGFLNTMTQGEGIEFLGELIGAYGLSVPEPLFRFANTFLGLHQTADILPIDDNLPMTDEMILFGWQYHWFYTWLGH